MNEKTRLIWIVVAIVLAISVFSDSMTSVQQIMSIIIALFIL
jgi:hypothetical protein